MKNQGKGNLFFGVVEWNYLINLFSFIHFKVQTALKNTPIDIGNLIRTMQCDGHVMRHNQIPAYLLLARYTVKVASDPILNCTYLHYYIQSLITSKISNSH